MTAGPGSAGAGAVRTIPDETEASPNSYTIVLPPEWIRVSLTGTVEQPVKDIADRMFRRLPRDEFLEERRRVEELLTAMVRDARANQGLDMFLPVEPMHGRTIAASFVVGGAVMPDELDDVESVALIGSLAQDGALASVDGVPGVRTERVEFPEKHLDGRRSGGIAELGAPSRRVDYVFPIPGDLRRWLTVSFSTPGAGDPGDQVADALVELFDAMMTTFRWRCR